MLDLGLVFIMGQSRVMNAESPVTQAGSGMPKLLSENEIESSTEFINLQLLSSAASQGALWLGVHPCVLPD